MGVDNVTSLACTTQPPTGSATQNYLINYLIHYHTSDSRNYYLYFMSPETINKAHDHFCRESLQNKSIVCELLIQYLDSSILNSIDLSTLTINKDLWIDTNLSEHIADIVYVAKIKNSRNVINFLFEHKSTLDKKVAVQNFQYIIQIWSLILQQKKKVPLLPVVIPVIIYNGKKLWNIDNSLRPLLAIIKGTDQFIPDYKSIIIDLNSCEKEIKSSSYLVKAFFLALKLAKLEGMLGKIPEIIDLFQFEGADNQYLSVVLHYLYSVIDSSKKKQFKIIAKRELKKGNAQMKSLADALWEEGEKAGERKGLKTGRKQGIQQGFEQGIRKGVKQGIRQGVQKGRKQGITEGKSKQKQIDMVTMASQLLKKDMPAREISLVTGLSLRKIQILKKKNDTNLSPTDEQFK